MNWQCPEGKIQTDTAKECTLAHEDHMRSQGNVNQNSHELSFLTFPQLLILQILIFPPRLWFVKSDLFFLKNVWLVFLTLRNIEIGTIMQCRSA